MTFRTFCIFFILIAATILISQPAVAQDEPAQVIFVPLFQDEDLIVDLYTGDTRIQQRVPMRMNTNPITLPAGQYKFYATVHAGQQVVAAAESLRLQPGRTYLLVGSGAMSDGTALVDIFPVTWNDEEPRLIFLHHMAENRLLDLKIDGDIFLNNIDGNTVGIQPIVADTLKYFEAINSRNGNVISFAGYEGIDIYNDLTYLVVQARNRYLDVQPVFLENPTIVDGGVVRPGDVSQINLQIGMRIRYSLTVTETTNLNVNLQSGTDPYLRIYNVNNHLIWTHDDLSNENLNAGIFGFQFATGTYFIEVGSYADAFPGTYTFSVSRPG